MTMFPIDIWKYIFDLKIIRFEDFQAISLCNKRLQKLFIDIQISRRYHAIQHFPLLHFLQDDRRYIRLDFDRLINALNVYRMILLKRAYPKEAYPETLLWDLYRKKAMHFDCIKTCTFRKLQKEFEKDIELVRTQLSCPTRSEIIYELIQNEGDIVNAIMRSPSFTYN